MIDPNKLKTALQEELDSLRAIREELLLKSALAKADARTEWNQLETRFQRAQEEIKRIESHSKTALHEIEASARSLIQEIKGGYERIRHVFEA